MKHQGSSYAQSAKLQGRAEQHGIGLRVYRFNSTLTLHLFSSSPLPFPAPFLDLFPLPPHSLPTPHLSSSLLISAVMCATSRTSVGRVMCSGSGAADFKASHPAPLPSPPPLSPAAPVPAPTESLGVGGGDAPCTWPMALPARKRGC